MQQVWQQGHTKRWLQVTFRETCLTGCLWAAFSPGSPVSPKCLSQRRFVWALVHSPDPAHIERGLDLAQQMLNHKELDQQGQDDLVYFCAVVSLCLCGRVSSASKIGMYLIPR